MTNLIYIYSSFIGCLFVILIKFDMYNALFIFQIKEKCIKYFFLGTAALVKVKYDMENSERDVNNENETDIYNHSIEENFLFSKLNFD